MYTILNSRKRTAGTDHHIRVCLRSQLPTNIHTRPMDLAIYSANWLFSFAVSVLRRAGVVWLPTRREVDGVVRLNEPVLGVSSEPIHRLDTTTGVAYGSAADDSMAALCRAAGAESDDKLRRDDTPLRTDDTSSVVVWRRQVTQTVHVTGQRAHGYCKLFNYSINSYWNCKSASHC